MPSTARTRSARSAGTAESPGALAVRDGRPSGARLVTVCSSVPKASATGPAAPRTRIRRDGASAATTSSPASRHGGGDGLDIGRIGAELPVGPAAQDDRELDLLRRVERAVVGGLGCGGAGAAMDRGALVFGHDRLVRAPSDSSASVSAGPIASRPVTAADPLAPLIDLEGVADGVAAARAAVDALLGNRALRRRSADVSAESSLRGAWASAVLAGADASLDDVRSGGSAGDPVVQGALRAQAAIPSLADTWTRAPRQALARLHALAAADLAGQRPARPSDRRGRPPRHPGRGAGRHRRPRSSSPGSCTASSSRWTPSRPRPASWPVLPSGSR